MSQNKKLSITGTDRFFQLVSRLGIVLMSAATVTGMLELPDHPNGRVVLPAQSAFILATENDEANNPIRREREESAPHYISYTETQRTVSRSSKK